MLGPNSGCQNSFSKIWLCQSLGIIIRDTNVERPKLNFFSSIKKLHFPSDYNLYKYISDYVFK